MDTPLSREFLLEQGHCCDNNCINCPYKDETMKQSNTDRQYEDSMRNTSIGWIGIIVSVIMVILMAHCQPATAQTVYEVQYKNQADVLVYEVDYPSQADIKYYVVQYKSQANEQKHHWYYVQYPSQAQYTIYWVKYKSQADTLVYRVDYPSQTH